MICIRECKQISCRHTFYSLIALTSHAERDVTSHAERDVTSHAERDVTSYAERDVTSHGELFFTFTALPLPEKAFGLY